MDGKKECALIRNRNEKKRSYLIGKGFKGEI